MTVQVRKLVYEHLLKEYKSRSPYMLGFCGELSIMINSHDTVGKISYDFSPHIEDYPEIMKQKPDNKPAYWWPLDTMGREIRISVLERAIKLCDQQINKI